MEAIYAKYNKNEAKDETNGIPGNAMPLHESRADYDHPRSKREQEKEVDELIEGGADLVVDPQQAKVRTS